MKFSNIFKLTISIFACELAGVVGAIFTTPAIPAWYAMLRKPAISPPNWLFAPVWTTLYALMGIAAYLIWMRLSASSEHRKRALEVFALQLALNVLWSVIFFGMQNPFLGLVVIVLLLLAIVWTIVIFHKISSAAAYLLIPYILWVSFAAYLNYAVWTLN